jgi:hypothetical protein
MAEEAQVRQPQMGLTFEKVWAGIQESREAWTRSLQESRAAWERSMQESRAEHDREIAEMRANMKELSRNVRGNNRSLGELVETLIAARLWEKFAAYPYNLQRAYQRIPIYDEHNQAKTDVDILLVDTGWCMAVEVKREVDRDDVERHLKRMELIRKYPPAEVVGKKMLGAIAGGIVAPDAKEFAQKSGFFVLELKGESVALLDTPDGFTPREW